MAALLILLPVSVSALTTINDTIYDPVKKQTVILRGASWFGFNNGGTIVNGLWAAGDSISCDFATIVYRWQCLGFNAVRLPFSFTDLYGDLTPSMIEKPCVVRNNTAVAMSVVSPSGNILSNARTPTQKAPPVRANGTCNDYIPTNTTLDRFIYVVNYFAANGFYVLIDNHLREDQTVIQSPTTWLSRYADLITKLSANPTTASRLMVDILNEPDAMSISWSSLKNLYIGAMSTMYNINKQLLFFIEGTGQTNLGANFGDGFCTDQDLITKFSLSDPTPFFQQLLAMPYKDQVVLAPHVYGPSVSGSNVNYTGSGLYWRLTNSFGYLTQSGFSYTDPASKTVKVKKFPVAVGEFGSKFQSRLDIAWLDSFSLYMNNPATDGKHRPIYNWFYWDWNPNSADTGGLVMDDWVTPQWTKLDYLRTKMGLTPWWAEPINNTPNAPAAPNSPNIVIVTAPPLEPFAPYTPKMFAPPPPPNGATIGAGMPRSLVYLALLSLAALFLFCC